MKRTFALQSGVSVASFALSHIIRTNIEQSGRHAEKSNDYMDALVKADGSTARSSSARNGNAS
jgi:hypothetical protein